MSSLPSRPMSSGLPSRPSADGDRSPPRRGGGEQRRRGGGPSGPPGGSRPPPEDDYSDWRGPPGSRPPPRRPVGGTDRDMDRRRGSGGLPMRDRSPDRFDPRFERPFDPFAGRGGSGRDRPQFRGGRSRSRSWSPPPGGGRDRSRSPSRSPVMRRGGPGGQPRGGFDGPRYSGPPGGFRDRSPPPTRRRSPGPAYRKRSPSRSPPPSHRQFGGSRGAPAPVSPELERRRTSGGRFPPPPVARGRSPSRSPPPHIASTRDFPPQHARRGSREVSSRPRSRSRSPPPPPKRYRQGSTPPHLPHSARPPPPAEFSPAAPAPARSGGPPIHPSRIAHVQQVSAPPSRPSTAPDSEREEGEVDIDSVEQQPQSSVPKWGKGSVAQPPLPDIPTGPRQRFGVPTVPAPRGGGRGGARGGMGGRGGYGAGAAYDTAPAFDPSPSPVSAPLPLPPPPSNGSAPVPTGPKQRWNTRPTPTSSTLPLPPTSSAGVSPRPAVGALPLSDEEVAAQQARAEREAREERERLEKMAKERELSMLKIQVMKWLPKGVVRVPTGPIADLEAEILRIHQNRLTVILPSQLARTLSSRKLYNELGLVMSEREVARDKLRCAESGSGAAMSRSSSGGV